MEIQIEYKKEILKVKVENQWRVSDIKKAVLAAKRVPIIQQELSYKQKSKDDPKVVLSDDQQPVNLLNFTNETVLVLKNLGNQVEWSFVFYIQYLGPIVIFAMSYFYGNYNAYTSLQKILFGMGIIHFLKRQLETIFVHVFSRNSMPAHRALINIFHYWVLFGLFVGIELFYFWHDPHYSNTTIYTCVAIWAICEFCNLQCHRVLASFRKDTPQQLKQKKDSGYVNPAKVRKIPYGWGFDYISSANYFWQTVGWVTFSVLSRCYTSYFFTVCSVYQMLDWALKKHKNYKKQFSNYPKQRKAMFPFII